MRKLEAKLVLLASARRSIGHSFVLDIKEMTSRSASASPPLPLRRRAGVQRITRILRKIAPSGRVASGKPPSPLVSRAQRESGMSGSESRQQVLLSPCRVARGTAGVDSTCASASSLVGSDVAAVDDATLTSARRTSEPWSVVHSAPNSPAHAATARGRNIYRKVGVLTRSS